VKSAAFAYLISTREFEYGRIEENAAFEVVMFFAGGCLLTGIGSLYLCATKIGASSSDINVSARLL
jgi:hypothetical protein